MNKMVSVVNIRGDIIYLDPARIEYYMITNSHVIIVMHSRAEFHVTKTSFKNLLPQ